MKRIIRVIPVSNGVFARLGGDGPKGIQPGKCGALFPNKTDAINAIKERYPADEYEIIDVNEDRRERPFKPVNITKSQPETSKVVASVVPEASENSDS